jgi:putative MATE family efflux protein
VDEVGVWPAIRASLVGRRLDYTRGSIGRSILLLSVPMVLEMMMESLFAVTDTYFVGKLGTDAVAAVGLTASLVTVIFCLAFGLSMAATAMVARRIGAKDVEGANVVAVQCVIVGFIVSVPLGIVGAIYAKDLLLLMNASGETAALGEGYATVMFAGNVTTFQLFLTNAVFRGAGDPILAMRALWLGNAINIVLDPILIFGWGPIPAMGLVGAGWATVIGRGIGVVYQLKLLARSHGRIAVRRVHLRFDPAIVHRIFTTSGWGIVQLLVGMASWIAVMRFLADFGDDALAGYTIALRVIIFILLPAWGIANAAATLVGQNLGAGQPDRAEHSAWITCHANAVFLASVAALFFFGARPLASIFTDVEAAIDVAADCLRIVALSYPFLAYGMTTVQAFNGAGDTRTPTWLNLFAYWVVQIPVAWALAWPLGLGPTGVFIAITIGQLALAGAGVLAFRRGSWKHRVV